jgi:hypothetical protein
MEADGIVGQHNGSQAREVIMTLNDWYKLSAKKYRDNGKSFATNEHLVNQRMNITQKASPKVLAEVLTGGRTKTIQKQLCRQNNSTTSTSTINSNINQHAVPITPEINFANNYNNNNNYFDPDYENNNIVENNQEDYNGDF